MAQYGFYFDSSRCTGCKTCEMACKDYKNLDSSIAFRKVYDYEGGSFTDTDGTLTHNVFSYHVSQACNHCDSPACLAVCPAGAVFKDDDSGLVYIDAKVCSGQKVCIDACPYGVPLYDSTVAKGVKCDGCRDRNAQGLKPICVDACPLRALDFGEIEELRSKYGDNASIAPLPDPSKTQPNLTVKMAAAAKPSEDTTGFIANPLEVS